jgi:hypothetical protein
LLEGELRAAAGDRVAARDCFEAAVAAFRQMHMPAYVSDAERRLQDT